MARCPVVDIKRELRAAAGRCTEAAALQALYKELVDLAEKILNQEGTPCVGACDLDENRCTLVVTLLEKVTWGLVRAGECLGGLGFLATYDGLVQIQCKCLPRYQYGEKLPVVVPKPD
jgi:hypothetical protein